MLVTLANSTPDSVVTYAYISCASDFGEYRYVIISQILLVR